MPLPNRPGPKQFPSSPLPWELRLYVAGQNKNSVKAFSNLKKICEEHLHAPYQIQVVDLLAEPQLAREHQILALPTLVRESPEPIKKLVGDLSDTNKVLEELELKPEGSSLELKPEGRLMHSEKKP